MSAGLEVDGFLKAELTEMWPVKPELSQAGNTRGIADQLRRRAIGIHPIKGQHLSDRLAHAEAGIRVFLKSHQRHDGRHLTSRGEHDDRVRSVIPKSRGVQGARGIHHDIADAVEDNAVVNKSLKRLVDLGEVWLGVGRWGGSTPI